MNDASPGEARREALVRLGAERLADALLLWAEHAQPLARALELMIEEGDPKRLAAALRRRIDSLARDDGYVPYAGSREFAREIGNLVDTIRARLLAHDPLAAFELADALLKADAAIIERADDSDGDVADVLRDAAALWIEAAARRPEPLDWEELIFERISQAVYGVRNPLLAGAGALLEEAGLRRLVARFEEVAERAESDRPQGQRWPVLDGWVEIALLARALRDPALHESAVTRLGGRARGMPQREIAEFYLECGDPAGALEFLERSPKSSNDPDWSLRARCHAALGQREAQIDALWHAFDRTLWWDTYEELLALHAPEEVERVRQRARECALHFRHAISSIQFLLRAGWPDEAERRALDQAVEFTDAGYHGLLGLTEQARAAGRPRIEVLCYRALLLDILETARSRAYHHAASYLLALEKLDAKIAPGDPLGRHAEFILPVREKHRRKASFWAQVEQARRE